jgi:xanthine/CO dehydrogenase XdhC/CoxF family maturation factor
LIEPLNPELKTNPVSLLKQVIAKRQKSVLVTLFSLENHKGFQPGTCLLQLESGETYSSNINRELKTSLLNDVEDVSRNQTSSIKNITAENTHFTAFIEFLKPAISLVIVGAGNDAIPLAQTAHILGWHSTVIDGRPSYATTQRFPLAHEVRVCKPEKALEEMAVDDHTVFVLMTHNYNYDLAMLRQLIDLNTPYIGSLGPKKKMERMLDELREEGMEINKDQLSKLYGPVGFDIGAETAEEIALSITSEIKAVLSNRSGQSLRDRPETIHLRSFAEISSTINS